MNNTKTYSGSRKGVARFVKDQLTRLNPDCAVITIMGRGLLEDYSALTVIEGSLADIERLVAKSSLEAQQTTSQDLTLGG